MTKGTFIDVIDMVDEFVVGQDGGAYVVMLEHYSVHRSFETIENVSRLFPLCKFARTGATAIGHAQPLDIVVNCKFKARLRKHVGKYFARQVVSAEVGVAEAVVDLRLVSLKLLLVDCVSEIVVQMDDGHDLHQLGWRGTRRMATHRGDFWAWTRSARSMRETFSRLSAGWRWVSQVVV